MASLVCSKPLVGAMRARQAGRRSVPAVPHRIAAAAPRRFGPKGDLPSRPFSPKPVEQNKPCSHAAREDGQGRASEQERVQQDIQEVIEYIADCVAKRKALKAKLEVEQGTEARQFLREQLTFLQEQLTFLQGQLMELLKMENRLAGAQNTAARSASSPTGPPRFPLLSAGRELRPYSSAAAGVGNTSKTTAWELGINNAGGQPYGLYVDPSGVVKMIERWIEYRCTYLGASFTLSPLLISGLVKVGKTCTLLEVVPAVVSTALRKRPDCAFSNITLLHLDGDSLFRQGGATALLLDLLATATRWAADGNVPVDQTAWAFAQDVLAKRPGHARVDEAGNAVVSLMHGFKVPVLVLFDELQSFLQPNVGGQLDQPGARYIRDVVLKKLLVYAPNSLLWCLTGSDMALVWMAIADMPTNGPLLLSMAPRVDLPATYPEDLVELVWARLAKQFGLTAKSQLGARLLEWCDTSPALVTGVMTRLVGRFELTGEPQAVDNVISGFVYDKIVYESRKGWALALSDMPPEARRTVLDLAWAGVGTNIDFLHKGLTRFLEPYLEVTEHGCFFLKSDYQRQMLRMVIDPDGSLSSRWYDLQCGATLSQLDWGCTLMCLGAVADYLFSVRKRQYWERTARPSGSEHLWRMLESLAEEVSKQLPGSEGGSVASRWEQQPWFQEALQSKWNSDDRSWFDLNKGLLVADVDMLVFFLRLSRNVLAHQKPWAGEGEQLVDVDVVMALPRVLGMRVSHVSSMVITELRKLARSTVEVAIEEYNKEPQLSAGSGGGGGSSGGRGGGRGGKGGKRGGQSGKRGGKRSKGGKRGRGGGRR